MIATEVLAVNLHNLANIRQLRGFPARMMPVEQRANEGGILAHKRVTGITLLELLLALGVVAILATIAFESYEKYFDKARVTEAKADIFGLDVRINGYYAVHNSYPETLDDIGGAPLDPWDNPYRYLNIQTAQGRGGVRKDHNLVPINGDFDLYSMGKDGASVPPLTARPSRDDIIRANNGGFIGLAEDY